MLQIAAADEPAKVEAIADLVALHSAAENYMEANENVWPQFELKGGLTQEQIAKYWRDKLKPYGAESKHWAHSKDPWGAEMSYLPTAFSTKQDEAFRWKTRPWFVQKFKSKSGMWLVCQNGKPEKFESEVPTDLAALHSAMNKYLKANGGVWPQETANADESLESYAKFWAETLKPYGAEKEHWVNSKNPSDFGMDYTVAAFSPKKDMAYQWKVQPWFAQVTGEETGMWIVCHDGEPRIHFSAPAPTNEPDPGKKENK